MSKLVTILAFAAVALAPYPLAAQQLDENTQRQLSVQQVQAYQAGGGASTMKLEAAFDHPNGTYADGERVRLLVRNSEDAYVTIVTVGPTGKSVQLFPNDSQPQNLVKANTPLQIPAPGSNAQIVVSAPFGTELIKVVASSAPKGLVPNSSLSGMGAFRSIDGGVDELVRNLAIAAAPAAGTKFAQQNLVLQTVAQAQPSGNVVVPPVTPPPQIAQAPTPPLPQQNLSAGLLPAINNPFPLLIATDKNTYRVGERVTLAITSFTACSLSVFDVAANGQARLVFPNKTMNANAIPAMQMTMLSGGSSPVTIDVRGPAGNGSLVAICSTDPTPTTVIAPDQTNIFTMIPSLDGLRQDFALLARRPAGSTSVSSISVSVQP
ncbi:MAG: hypothetical protein V7604_5048 [Hyphomicrobiales bacterium]|jgi:hypothetical protein